MNAGPTLLLASSGGHIRELAELVRILRLRPELCVWGSSRGRQLEGLASQGWRTVEVPLCEPRDTRALRRAIVPAYRILRALKPQGVLTTGSAVALPFALGAIAQGIPYTFVESLTRVAKPSRTGSIVELLPFLDLRTQVHPWSRRRGPVRSEWRRTISALDGFAKARRDDPPMPKRVFVSTGIMTREYPFERLYATLERVVPEGVEVRVQGGLDRRSSRLTMLPDLAPAVLAEEMRAADAVIVHAGVGLSLDCFDLGINPLVVPREGAFGEHVDDHQLEFAQSLNERDLGTLVPAAKLDWASIVESTRYVTRRVQEPVDPALLGLKGLSDERLARHWSTQAAG